MGTRYEDQPVEHWAGPESLDPTPVWRQYLIVAAFVLVALVLVVAVGYSALAVELATPPATLIGGRVVLSTSDVPSVGAAPKRFGPPPGPSDGAFYLVQPQKGAIVAIKENWRPEGAGFVCVVGPEDPIISKSNRSTFSWIGCGRGSLGFGLRPSSWDARGDPIAGTDQPLDRYLVSVEGAKVVVNTSRVISGVRKVPAPSNPTFR
jgi:hypothetical protein